MNYFGHAAIAGLRRAEPPFVFGAMLPDLLGMCGMTRHSLRGSTEVEEGVLFHQRTDSLFHSTSTFVTHHQLTLQEMKVQDVRKGPARAAAHIGVEMLIDAELARHRKHLQHFHASLDWILTTIALAGDETALTRLRALAAHLLREGDRVHVPSQERFELRLARTLAGRARLAPTHTELRIVARICSEASGRVARDVPQLLGELAPLLK